jgi:hypothetical protein
MGTQEGKVVAALSGQEEEYQFPFSSEDNNIAAAGLADG